MLFRLSTSPNLSKKFESTAPELAEMLDKKNMQQIKCTREKALYKFPNGLQRIL